MKLSTKTLAVKKKGTIHNSSQDLKKKTERQDRSNRFNTFGRYLFSIDDSKKVLFMIIVIIKCIYMIRKCFF